MTQDTPVLTQDEIAKIAMGIDYCDISYLRKKRQQIVTVLEEYPKLKAENEELKRKLESENVKI
jgi:hypothetical protein